MHSSIATILTPRLNLSAATRGDAWELWELWNRPPVRDALFGPAPLSIDSAATLVQACAARSPGLWVVRSPLSSRLVGCVSLCGWPHVAIDRPLPPATRVAHAELSVAMLPSVWGRGYGFEAASAVIEQALRDTAAGIMQATSRHGDASALSLLYRLGFRRALERMGGSGPCIDWSLQAPIFFALLRARTRLAQERLTDQVQPMPKWADRSAEPVAAVPRDDDFLDTDVMLNR
jgi:RimJ/RimL family protein N-acetyltransferase